MTTQNPLDRTLGFAQGLSGLQSQAQARAGEEQRQGMLQQEQEQVMQQRQGAAQANQDMQGLAAQYAETGDPAVMRQIIMTNPDFAQKIQTQLGVVDESTKAAALNEASTFKRMLETDPAAANQYYQANLAGSPTWAGLADNLAGGDIEGAINEIGYATTALGGQEAYDQVFGGGGGIPMENQPSSVQEYNFYSNLPLEQQKQYLNMKRSSQMFAQGDVQMGVDPTNPGLATPIVEPGAAPATQPDVQQALTEQSALKVATEDAAKQAIGASKEAFDQLVPIKKNISNLDEAIRLVDEEGANTGAIASKLPSLMQSSIALDNVQRRMGLDVISSVTFGALSAGELTLALATALPTGLDGPELTKWLKSRKASQTKMANYLEKAATYLGTPGNTVASFMTEKNTGADFTKAETLQELDDWVNQ